MNIYIVFLMDCFIFKGHHSTAYVQFVCFSASKVLAFLQYFSAKVYRNCIYSMMTPN